MNDGDQVVFTSTNLTSGSTVTAMIPSNAWGLLGDLTIAKDNTAVSVPMVTAVQIAAETIRLLLDEGDLCNCDGQALTEWLGDEDADTLRYLLSRIAGPEDPTFTVPHHR